MRKIYAGAIFGFAVLLVLGVIVLTWRPWEEGANSRITASGLVPVLTLLIGQLGAWVISSGSNEQAIAVRRAELAHDVEQERQVAIRVAEEKSASEASAFMEARREVYLQLVRATSEAAPVIARVAMGAVGASTADALSQLRVAVLTALSSFERGSDLRVAADLLLGRIDNYYVVSNEAQRRDAAERLLEAMTNFDRSLGESTRLR